MGCRAASLRDVVVQRVTNVVEFPPPGGWLLLFPANCDVGSFHSTLEYFETIVGTGLSRFQSTYFWVLAIGVPTRLQASQCCFLNGFS